MIHTILCALGLAYAGMASLSLAMDRHHGQVWGRDAAPNVRRTLQLAGALLLGLVIGGAIGNVIDRMIHGHVVDFIQWHWRDYYWPSFNIADSAIVAGAVGIAAYGVFGGKPAEPRPGEGKA